MATLRSLNIDLRAGTARLAQDFKRAGSIVGSFEKDMKQSFDRAIGSVFNLKTAVATLVGSAGFGLLVKNAFASADALAKSADKMGMTTQALAGLQHMAGLAGISTEQLDSGLKTMQKNIVDFYNGTGRATEALRAMGFTQAQLIAMSPDQQFAAIADAMNQVKTSAERTNYALKIFGDSGAELINVMSDGSAGMRAAAEEAKALGLALTRVDTAKIEAANDAFDRAKGAVSGMANTVALQLAPVITALSNDFTDLVKRNNGFRDQIISGFESATKAVGFFADVIQGLRVVFKGVEVIAIGFVAGVLTVLDELNKGTAAVLNAMIDAVSAPLIKVFDIMGKVSDTAKGMAEELRNAFKFTPSPELTRWADGMRGALVDAETELHTLAMTPMPSKNIEAWFAKVRAEAQAAAEAVAAAKAPKAQQVDTGLHFSEKEKDALRQQLLTLRESMFTAEEVIADSYAKRAEIVGNALQAQIINESTAKELLLQLETDFRDKIAEQYYSEEEALANTYQRRAEMVANAVNMQYLTEASGREMLLKLDSKYQLDRKNIEMRGGQEVRAVRESMYSNAVNLLSLFAGKSKIAALAIIAIQKAQGIAQTIINTQVASMRALAELGPIAGAAAAAKIQAMGAVSVGLIAATGLVEAAQTFSGGGSAGGIGAAASPTYPANPVSGLPQQAGVTDARTTKPQMIQVNIQGDGDVVSKQWIRDTLIPEINDALGDGATLQVAR